MLRMGLVGAGPWAKMFHGPMLASAASVELVGVWARRPEAAQEIASAFGGRGYDDVDALIADVDAVAFCVPPVVQAELALRAARAGRHLLLEKPLAHDLAAARALVETIEQAGVISQMVLTSRYLPSTADFIATAQAVQPLGASATWVSGAILPGQVFATPWRQAEGMLLDVGPHAFDLLDAAIGPIVGVKAHGDPTRFLTVVITHDGGQQSTVVFSGIIDPAAATTRVEVFGSAGKASFGGPDPSQIGLALAAITDQLVAAVESGTPHPLDARRGLYLQELIEQAAAQL